MQEKITATLINIFKYNPQPSSNFGLTTCEILNHLSKIYMVAEG